MPLLKNRVLPLHALSVRCVADNIGSFWKEEWDSELETITELSDTILLNLPSKLRLDILLEITRTGFLDKRATLLLLDQNTLNLSLDEALTRKFETFYGGYFSNLMSRRCLKSTSLSLKGVPTSMESSLGIALATFTEMKKLRLECHNGHFVDEIGSNLHNLEELYLGDLSEEDASAIQTLVTGCPKLKVLHVGDVQFLETIQHLLLGLPNLREFKQSSMVHALEKIINDGRADAVASLRNVYIGEEELFCEDADNDELECAALVMKHFPNICKVEIDGNTPDSKTSATFTASLSKLTGLTELTLMNFPDFEHVISPVGLAVGHQLTTLDLDCRYADDFFPLTDIISKCTELRVLRLRVEDSSFAVFDDAVDGNTQHYGRDLQEQFTPFQHLQELYLEGLIQLHLSSKVFKSLISSPVLQDITFLCVPNFTDHVVKSAFKCTNNQGQRLAFTSLRKMRLKHCNFVTNYIRHLVTKKSVPLEYLAITKCPKITKQDSWKLGRFELDVCNESNDSNTSSDIDMFGDFSDMLDHFQDHFDVDDYGGFGYDSDGSFDYTTPGQPGPYGLYFHKDFCYDM